MKITRFLVISLLAGSALLGQLPLRAQPVATNHVDDVGAQFQVLRSDFNANKIRTFNQVMKLVPAEAEAFWPVYKKYEKELAVVGDAKLALVREFFTHHQNGTLNDKNATVMAGKWLKNIQARLDLWKKYCKKISKAVSPMRAAQFLQMENQMAIFVDLDIASEMPVIAPAASPASPASPAPAK